MITRRSNMRFTLVFFLLFGQIFADSIYSNNFVTNIASLLGSSVSIPDLGSSNLAAMMVSKVFGVAAAGVNLGPSVIGNIFQVFNVGIMVVVGIVMGYTASMAVLNTAGEGSFMGQKMQSSYFTTVIRVTSGTAALFPVYGGYSAVQILMITMLMQGSALADLLWFKIVQSVNSGSGFKPTWFTGYSGPDGQSTVDASIKQFLDPPDTSNTVKNNGVFNVNLNNTANAGVNLYNMFVCEAVKDGAANSNYKVTINTDSATSEQCGKLSATGVSNFESFALGIKSLVMGDAYQTVVDSGEQSQDGINAKQAGIASISNMFAYLQEISQRDEQSGSGESFNLAVGAGKSSAVSFAPGWMGAGSQHSAIENSGKSKSSFEMENISYRYTAPNPSNVYGVYKLTITSDAMKNYLVDNSMTRDESASHSAGGGYGSLTKDAKDLLDIIKNRAGSVIPSNGLQSSLDVFNHKVDVGQATMNMTSYKPINDDFQFLTWTVINKFDSIFISEPQRLFTKPLTNIKDFGMLLITSSVTFFMALTADVINLATTSAFINMFAMAIASVPPAILQGVGYTLAVYGDNQMNACWGSPPPPGGTLAWYCFPLFLLFIVIFINFFTGLVMKIVGSVIAVIGAIPAAIVPQTLSVVFKLSIANKLIYIGLATAISAPLLALGGAIAFYVPFIPVLAYTLAVLTWIFQAIESLIAVPIILLGVTYPQGHDLLGKSEQAMMLFLGIMLRPSLIIAGYVFSIVVTGVTMMLANLTFARVLLSIFKNLPNGEVSTIVFIMMSFVFVAIFLVNVVDYSFGFIYKLPQTTMKWIGLPTVESQEEQIMQEIKGGASSASSEMATGATGYSQGLNDKALGLQK